MLQRILEKTKEPHKSRKWSSLDEAVNIISAEEDVHAYSNADSDNWEEWIKQFEVASQYINNDKDKLQRLRSRLLGNARRAFDNLEPSCKEAYSNAVIHLRKALYLAKFNAKVMHLGLKQYRRELQLLAETIHPGNDHNKELLMLERLNCDVRDRYRSIQWKSVDEAVLVMSAAEKVPEYGNQDDENWGEWKNMLMTAANEYKLDTSQNLTLLSCCLTGSAKTIFKGLLNSNKCISIEILEKKLCFARFMSREKKPCETWETVKKDLRSLEALYHPEEFQVSLLVRFCSIVEKQCIVLCREPVSLDDAVDIVTAQKAIPKEYSGEDDWMEWIKQFEHALFKHNIGNDVIKLKYLELRLTGWAFKNILQ